MVCYQRFPMTGVTVKFAKFLVANGDIIEAQRIVAVWFTKCLILTRRAASFRYVANVADRNLV